MGAEYLEAGTSLPHDVHRNIVDVDETLINRLLTPKVQDRLVQFIMENGISVIDTCMDLDEDIEESLDAIREFVTEHGAHFVLEMYQVFYELDESDLSFDKYGVPMYTTGGESWGDSPTDDFDAVALIGTIGIFDKPIFIEDELQVPRSVSDMLREFADVYLYGDRRTAVFELAMHAENGTDLLSTEEARRIYGGLMLSENIEHEVDRRKDEPTLIPAERVTVVYDNANGGHLYQPLEDVMEVGTLILNEDAGDAEGDDAQIIGITINPVS